MIRTAALMVFMAAAQVATGAARFPEFMAGSWRGVTDAQRMEEHWTTPDGRMMVGMHRDTGSERSSFEFLRIEAQGGTLVYLAMPAGRPAVAFPLKTIEANRIVFENLKHDFPQRVIYWRADDRLCARVEGPSTDGDDAAEWCWERAPSPSVP